MAEEAKETIDTETEKPAFDEAKMSEMIKANVSTSMKEVIDQLNQNKPVADEPRNVQQDNPDFWDDIVNPRVTKHTAKANLAAEAAEDKLDFYTSDDWTEEVEEFLVEDDPTKRKAEKKAIRDEVEKIFKNLISTGRGLPRKDICDAVLAQKLKKDRIKYQEAVVNRHNKRKESDLDKAKRGVDITAGNISNFTPSQIHEMTEEKMLSEFGSYRF